MKYRQKCIKEKIQTKRNIYHKKISEELEKSNELKQKELELIQYWIDFEVKKYTDNLTIRRIEK